MGNPAAGDKSYNDEQIREDDGDLGDDADDDNDDKQKEKVRLREQNEKYLRWSFWIYPPPHILGWAFFSKCILRNTLMVMAVMNVMRR